MSSPEKYAERGWQIFPCHGISRGRCTCSKGIDCTSPGKHPRTHNGVKDASSDVGTVQAWMRRWPDSNWAVACGQVSGLLVIDIDPRKNGFGSIEQLEQNRQDGPLPTTLTSRTGGGGRHLFYAAPAVPVGNRTDWLDGVDVKSDGGYVILPSSVHISGGTYTWVDFTVEPAQAPADVLQSISAAAGRGQAAEDLPSTDDILNGVPEGKRDDTLFRFACRLRRQLGDGARRLITGAVLAAAANAEPPFPEDQALKCVDSAFKQDHEDSYVAWQGGTGHELRALTDLGNAYRFLDQFGQEILFVEGWGWLTWSEQGWRRDNARAEEMAHEVHKMVQAEAVTLEADGADKRQLRAHIHWATQSQSAGSLSAVVRVAQKIGSVRRDVEDFDADDHLIACRNGVVDLRTGELRSVDRDDLVTKNTGVVYDAGYRLEAWERFLLQSLDGDQEMVDYMQRAVGYTLTGSNAEEAFFVVDGPPASGKSTLLDAMHAALGSYATSTQAETIMYRRGQQTPPNELARLAGMRFVSVSEIREGESYDEAIIKQFTGGDRVSARFLYQDVFEFRPQLKLWVGTNHDPDARDDAMWRRIKKLRFPNAIPHPKRDPRLKAMLRDPDVGGRAVLAWAVRGAVEWHRNGLCEPMNVTAQVAAYREEQDRMRQFITDCLVQAPGQVVTKNDLFAVYRSWCSMTSEPVKRQPQFVKAMESRGVKTGMDDRGGPVFKDVMPRQLTVTAEGASWT